MDPKTARSSKRLTFSACKTSRSVARRSTSSCARCPVPSPPSTRAKGRTSPSTRTRGHRADARATQGAVSDGGKTAVRRLGYIVAALWRSPKGGQVALTDAEWNQNQRAAWLQLDGLHDPTTSKTPATAALRLGDVNPSGSPCLLASPGSLGVPTCGSPTTLFTPDAPLVFGGVGGTHLQLQLDGDTVGLSGGDVSGGWP